MRHVKRGGKLWIRVFPDKPVTPNRPKPDGCGKGAVDHWVAVVKPGRVIFEISGVQEERRAKRCGSRLTNCPLGPNSSVARRRWEEQDEITGNLGDDTRGDPVKLDDAYAELFNLRFQFSTGQMQNSARLGQMRREIAR